MFYVNFLEDENITFRKMPTRSTEKSNAFDLYVANATIIFPQELGLIRTGLTLSYPEGWIAFISLRSSTPKNYGLLMPHGIGVIDRDYSGPKDELKIQVWNFRNSKSWINAGDRIAQLLFVRQDQHDIELGYENNINRGGFGSTG